jgi:hypothetical protein
MRYKNHGPVHRQIEIQHLTIRVLPGADVPTYLVSEDCGADKG